MTKTPLTRTYYFDGELLNQSTFDRDQQFVRSLNQYQNSFLFTPGIVDGLVASGASSTTLSLSTGMAFDGNGTPLFLVSGLTQDMTKLSLTSGSTYFISLIYSDSSTNGTPTTQLQQSMTITETPILAPPSPTAPTDPAQIPICCVTMGDNGLITSIDATAGGKRTVSKSNLASASGGAGDIVQSDILTSTPEVKPTEKLSSKASPEPDSTIDTGVLKGPLKIGASPDDMSQLSVSTKFSKSGPQNSVANFSYAGPGKAKGGIKLAQKRSQSGFDLIAASASGSDVWFLDTFGTAHSAADSSQIQDAQPIKDALKAIQGISAVNVAGSTRLQRRLSVIADDVADIAPEIVGNTNSGIKTVAYSGLTCLLIEAVKALAAKIETLEAKG